MKQKQAKKPKAAHRGPAKSELTPDQRLQAAYLGNLDKLKNLAREGRTKGPGGVFVTFDEETEKMIALYLDPEKSRKVIEQLGGTIAQSYAVMAVVAELAPWAVPVCCDLVDRKGDVYHAVTQLYLN